MHHPYRRQVLPTPLCRTWRQGMRGQMTEWVTGDVATIEAFDAEVCPETIPAWAFAAFFYAGGSSAAQVWDQDERQRIMHLHKGPIWVPTPGRDDPRKVASDAATELARLGLPQIGDQGADGCVLFWDLETGREPDPEWYTVAADRLHRRGYHSGAYGSLGYLFHYQARAGFWAADPTGQPHLTDHPNVVAEQYAWNVSVPGGRVNRDLIARSLLPNLWQPRAA